MGVQQEGLGKTMTKEIKRRGVDSVEVAGKLMQVMVQLGGTARLKTIAERAEMAPAKVHRYLVSLQAVGLLRQLAETQEYALGLLAYQLAEVTQQGVDLIDMVAPWVVECSREAGQACGVAMMTQQGVTIVRWFPVHGEISINLRSGTHVNVTTSCTGAVMAAHLPRSVTEPMVRSDLKNAGDSSKKSVEAVYDYYAQIRADGIANAFGTRIPGVNGVSVPVFNRLGEIAMVISMLGHETAFSALPDSKEATALKDLGLRLTGMMGGPSHSSASR
jgi:DNA-binding IclR family transcriptional regulator